MDKKLTLNFGEKVIQFKIGEFEDELDLDSLLKTDYQNLVAELITFPVMLNRLGILSAEMEAELRLAKLNLKVRESKLRQAIREELILVDEKGKVKNPTVQELEDALLGSKIYSKIHKSYYQKEKERDYIHAIYEAAKDKSKKLDKLSLTLQAGDIDDALVQKQLNRIEYKIREGRIK